MGISQVLGDTAETASAALGIEVLSMPSTSATVVMVVVDLDDEEGSGELPIGGIIGGAAGAVVIFIAGVLLVARRRRNKSREVAVAPQDQMDYAERKRSDDPYQDRKQAWSADDDEVDR